MTPILDLGAAGFPFRLQTPPSEAVQHRSWVCARDTALEALRRGEPVAVLGRAGTGKTLLLQSIGLALPGVMVVDEADGVAREELAALLASGKAFVVAALPGAILPLPAVRVMLEPLPAEEVAWVVAKRLFAAGRRVDLFEPEAIVELAKRSGGLMRLVLTLAGGANFFAEHDGVDRVTREHVAEAAYMRDVTRDATLQQSPVPAPSSVSALVGAALIVFAGAGFWMASGSALASHVLNQKLQPWSVALGH